MEKTLKQWKSGKTLIQLTEDYEYTPNVIPDVGVFGQNKTKIYYVNIKKLEDIEEMEEWEKIILGEDWYEIQESRKYKSRNAAMNWIRKLLKSETK